MTGKGNFKRCPVVFNMDNQAHRELYDWCMLATTNFSEFTRTLLSIHKSSSGSSVVSNLPMGEVQSSGIKATIGSGVRRAEPLMSRYVEKPTPAKAKPDVSVDKGDDGALMKSML